MSTPAEIKRVLILDRVVEVLKAIREGADYFATPASVEKRYTHFQEVMRGPAYSVHLDTEGEISPGMNDWWKLTCHYNVKGVVLDEKDPATALAHSIRDVCYAIDEDMRSSAAGSLGALCTGVFFDEPAQTDNGYFSLNGKGQFEQRIRIIMSGALGTL